MVRYIPMTLMIAIGWKSYSSMSRLLASIASQTWLPNEVVLAVNANYLDTSDNLLFDSKAWRVNDWNGISESGRKPSKSQIDYWNVFMRHISGANATSPLSQDLSLQRLKHVEYYWIGLNQPPRGSGPSETRKRMLPRASNQWLAYFDDDDLMHPRRSEFLWTAISKEHKNLDALYHASSMFVLNSDRAMASMLTWWFDPFIMYSDRSDIPRAFRQLSDDIGKHFANDYTRPLPRELQRLREKALLLPIKNKAHVGWKDALRHSPMDNIPRKCAKVVQGKERPPTPNKDIRNGNSRIHKAYERWGLYTDYAYDKEHWAPRMPDQHLHNQTIVMGWITIKKPTFHLIQPVDSDHDDNTYQFWRMHDVCRKTRFNYNVLGLYLKPYFYEY